MVAYMLRRLFQAFITLFVVSFLVFLVMYYSGDPVASLLPRQASAEQQARFREALGLDLPFHLQYLHFLSRSFRGDLGFSYHHNRPVTQMLAERAPATLELACVALLFSAVLGLPLGMLAGARPGSWFDRVVMGGSLFGISIPTFWLGLLLMMGLGVMLGWFPASGRGETRMLFGAPWSVLTLDGWHHIFLPALTLSLHHAAMTLRLMRAQMRRTLDEPFIRVCRAKGMSRARVVGVHALRHTLIPVVTVMGLQLGGLLAFSVVTETIFQWPGLGKLLIDSIYQDRPVVLAYLLMVALVFLGINIAVDLTYALIDPRIRLSQQRKSGE